MAEPKNLPALERRRRILDALHAQSHLQVDELAASLGVSRMTIHRDLATLERQGKLRKVHGGAAMVDHASETGTHCWFCKAAISAGSHTQVLLHLADNAVQSACCPHCGLLSLVTLGPDVTATLVTDFLYGGISSAQQALYVIGPAVRLCCTPTVLAFFDPADAARFQRGFGGEILDFDETLRYLRQSLTGGRHAHA